VNAEDVVHRFVEAINHADPARLAALMTEDHVFVDSDGTEVSGRAAMLDAWTRYFSMMRDYRVVVQETYVSSDRVVLVGRASGAWADAADSVGAGRWSVPAAWRAVVEGDRVAVWQVFVNPEGIAAARGSGAPPA